jgi:hypothetical protein
MAEEELHYYYNREERLKKASRRVQELYENKPKAGLFSSLVDTKAKSSLFIVIVIMCLMILFITYLLPESKTELGGNKLDAQALRYEDTCFIVLKKEVVKRKAYTGTVRVTVAPAYNHTIVFTDSKEEEFRWSIPLQGSSPNAGELLILLQGNENTASIKVEY